MSTSALMADNSEAEVCLLCDGTGRHRHPDDPVTYDCEACNGTGILYADLEGDAS